jgi:superfamily II DNA/RNA helicase
MIENQKDQTQILQKLNIEKLNPMQEEAQEAIASGEDVVLLSPTGTGKTVAFLLPIFLKLEKQITEVQALIVVPSRELALQIEQVARQMGTGFKVNSVYGGRAGSEDKMDLSRRPAILIGTPGRINDHLQKNSFAVDFLKTLVLDEFDKSLEIGFELEMSSIVEALPKVNQRILTSATNRNEIPAFVGLRNPNYINYLHQKIDLLKVKLVISPSSDKLETLYNTLSFIGNQPGIIFCNLRESIDTVSQFLSYKKYGHGCYHGGMEQKDRELELIKFRNGTHQLLVSTDLAARGLDIPELKFIIHFELPQKGKDFVHRNGRTARMNKDGSAFVLQGSDEYLPDFIEDALTEEVKEVYKPQASPWITLYITGGRRDKISKGDIAGLFLKQGALNPEDLGIIEIKQDSAFVAVKKAKAQEAIAKTNNSKLKTKKVRVSVI